MSTALISFYDFADHVSYWSNNASTLANQKSDFERKTNLTAVYNNCAQPDSGNSNTINCNSNTINVIPRRVVSASQSVPIGIAQLETTHSQPLQSRLTQTNIQSNITNTVAAMHPKSQMEVMDMSNGNNANNANNTQPQSQHSVSPVALVRAISSSPQSCNVNSNNINNNNNNNNNTVNNKNNANAHKKIDRSLSEPAEKSSSVVRLNQTAVAGPMSSRYKTELCRSFAEVGTCKYGDKCQFAHGVQELRVITRHPKFKTEKCKSFHSTGFCPYGPRCHFIHNSEESQKNILNNLQFYEFFKDKITFN